MRTAQCAALCSILYSVSVCNFAFSSSFLFLGGIIFEGCRGLELYECMVFGFRVLDIEGFRILGV